MAETKQGKQSKHSADNVQPTNYAGVQLLPLLIRYFKFVGVLLLIWLLGYFGFSTAWVMIGLFVYMSNNEYKKIKDAKKAFNRHAVLNEKEAILARVDELPAWVFFPDIEKAEWLNKIIKQMWPFVGNYTKQLLKTTVEPQVQNSLPKSLTPFKFEKIDLGDIPPRIGGVKVYIDHVKRDEIIMDFELIFMSDSDIKVAVKGIAAGIKDLQIHGTIRVQIRPLVNVMPIVGGLSVFFLNPPTIDFDLTNTANILDVPLLSNTLRSVVLDQISYYMVLPNKIPIQLVDNMYLADLKYPMPQGVLRLNVIGGRELKAADIKLLGKGKSDPYCNIYVGAQKFKTKVIQGTISPVWNEYFEAIVDQKEGQMVEIDVLDEDPGEDDSLGSASLDISSVATQGSIDTWLPLEEVSTGMIHVRAIWLHLSKDPDDLQKANSANEQLLSNAGSEEHLSAALLLVHLDSAKDLPRSKKGMCEPSPFVKIKVGNEEKTSIPQQNTTNPKWETNFEFLIHNPSIQDLSLVVYDSKKKDRKLGFFDYSMKNLLTCKDLTVNREFALKGSNSESTVTLRLCLRVLTSQMPEEWALDSGPSDTPETNNQLAPDTKAVPESIAAMAGTANMAVAATNIDTGEKVPPSNGQRSGSEDGHENSFTSAVMDRSGQDLRQRTSMDSSTSDAGWGKIRITIRYSQQRQKLVVVVHNCVNLIPCDKDHLADPYIRIYILPERSSSMKRKTEVCKNNLNPIYDETIEWPITLTEASSKTLEFNVKNEVGLFEKGKKNMGVALVKLSNYDLTKATTQWLDLMEPEED